MDELVEGTRAVLSGERDVAENKIFAHPLPFNVIPHIDKFQENGYTKEEMKVTWETRKICGLADDFPVRLVLVSTYDIIIVFVAPQSNNQTLRNMKHAVAQQFVSLHLVLTLNPLLPSLRIPLMLRKHARHWTRHPELSLWTIQRT